MEKFVRKKIRIYGIVQGVGFRPTVSRHARASRVTGTVANRGSFVEICAEGTEDQVSRFIGLVKQDPPERAVILKMDVKDLLIRQDFVEEEEGSAPRPADRWYPEFRIIESAKTSGEIFISPDIAVCETCRKELFDRTNRRYLHPFINCTCCGPRFSLLESLPYDRERTSMKKFPMCPQCAKEYHDPHSRRYDAQPVCCNDCGPEVYLLERKRYRLKEVRRRKDSEDPGRPETRIERTAAGQSAITRGRQILAEGGVLAVKGIGGFHLACDASSSEAVSRLRRLKRRPMKPFAVMVKDEAVCDRECVVSEEQRKILTGHQKPILLLKKRQGGRICEEVAPENPTVGVMLPYAPIQLLLFTYEDEWQNRMPDVLVMTSGNASGAPIASTDEEAEEEIVGFCDAILSNNRDIRIRTDDSVMDYYDGGPYMIRRSRGYAPLPFLVTENRPPEEPLRNHEGGSDGAGTEKKRSVLGIGGELKNTFCIGIGSLFYPSAYVGDMADIRTVRALEDAVRKMETLLETEPEVIACDLHPKYNSCMAAEKIAEKRKIPLLRVQHHYAHVLSCMAENNVSEPVIGISFDGTGYGTDGTIWGGEFLLSDTESFTRCAHIRPFLQTGGDASAREGWRIAASMLCGLYGKEAEEIMEKLDLCGQAAARVQRILHERRLNSVVSTSAGRLFDAASAILGIRRYSTFEGEAATALMYRALEADSSRPGEEAHMSGGKESAFAKGESRIGTVSPADPDVLPTDRLIRELTEARLAGREKVSVMALRFHEELADMIVKETVLLRKKTGIRTAALTGGVFQNTLLLGMVEKRLAAQHMKVIRHHMIPPNDGGIALGQAFYASQYLKRTGVQNRGGI